MLRHCAGLEPGSRFKIIIGLKESDGPDADLKRCIKARVLEAGGQILTNPLRENAYSISVELDIASVDAVASHVEVQTIDLAVSAPRVGLTPPLDWFCEQGRR
jgi:hypothetical protein